VNRINYKQISYLNLEWNKSQIYKFIEEDILDSDVTSEGNRSKMSIVHTLKVYIKLEFN